MIPIPGGATKFDICYGSVMFWKSLPTEYSKENAKWYRHWHYWSGSGWIEDRTVSTRRFRPIDEFFSSMVERSQ